MPLAKLSEPLTLVLASGRGRIQEQLTEVGKLVIGLNLHVHQGEVTKMYLKFAKLLGR